MLFQIYKAVLRTKKKTKKTAKITTVIKINCKHFIPITFKKIRLLINMNRPYPTLLMKHSYKCLKLAP